LEGITMTDTEVVSGRPDRPDGDPPLVDEQLADELVTRAQEQGAELRGPDQYTRHLVAVRPDPPTHI
jgi:hypothetical protein